MTIEEVNALDRASFVGQFGQIYEESPWVADAAWLVRPFESRADLEAKLAFAVAEAGADRRLSLIRSHPDLVGRAALAGRLGQDSTAEQAAAGLDRDALSAAEIAAFSELNSEYWRRFDMPFVICARENRKEAILAGFHQRLGHDRVQEIGIALTEIGRIAHHRLGDLVRDDPATVMDVGACR
jgi:OHCU decarboxylase